MAAQHPEAELDRLRTLIDRRLPALTVVTGASDFFRAEAMDLLVAAVPKDAELRLIDAAGERGGGGGDDDEEEMDDAGEQGGEPGTAAAPVDCAELLELRGGGLFARQAFVCVRRAAGWWKRHAVTVAGQLPRFSAGSGLVLEASKLDRRKKVAAALVKQLADSGSLFEFRDLYETPYDRSRSPLEGELCKWVVLRAQKLGVPMRAEAAWLFVAQVGKQPAELLAELGRLRDQLGANGKRKPLGPDDLLGKLTCSFGSTPFELADAVLGGDRRAALRSVRAMFDRGVLSKDGKPMDQGGLLPFTTSWLHRTFASVYEGRLLLDEGVALRDLPGRVGVRQFAERYVEQVQRHDITKLERGLLALHHCQRMSRLTGEEPQVLLERFLSQWFTAAPIPTAEDLDL